MAVASSSSRTPGPRPRLTGLTIAANEARGLGDPKGSERIKGGGLYFDGGAGAGLAVTATTLAANSVTGSGSEGGNLFWTGGAPPTFRDTIISGGVGPAGSENCVAEVDSFGFNLESRDQCGFDAGGDIVNTDPQLGPLEDNGGPTATMALATTSPAVDRGAAFGLATDQRGLPRPFDFSSVPNSSAAGADGSDIGAFELQPPAPPARIHDLILGKLQRNPKKGTATLTVSVPVPDPGTLTLSGKGLRSQTAAVSTTGIVKLAVVGNGVVKKALRLHHRRKVAISVTYAPARRRRGDQVADGEVDPQAEEAETALARSRLPLAALAAALWVLASATAAPADERTLVGHSVKGRPIVAISSGDTQRGAPAGAGRRLHPRRRDRRDAGRPQADRRRRAAAGRPLGRPHPQPRRRRRRHPRQRPWRRPQPQLPLRLAPARRRRILGAAVALGARVAGRGPADPPDQAGPDDLVPPAVRPRRPLRRRRGHRAPLRRAGRTAAGRPAPLPRERLELAEPRRWRAAPRSSSSCRRSPPAGWSGGRRNPP